MLNRPARLTASLAAMLTATAAFAEPTIEELDMRMRAMENTMQSILELLQEQQATTGAATAEAAAPTPERFSGLMLGICPMNLTRDEKVPNDCEGLPAATVRVSATNQYAFDDAMNVGALAPFAKVGDDQALALVWTGQILIEKAGKHYFQVNLQTTGKTAGAVRGGCYSKVVLNGQDIARAAGGISWTGDKPNYTDQGEINLEPGYYDFSVVMACTFDLHVDFHLRQMSSTVSFAEPGGSSLGPIPEDRLVTSE